MSAVMARVTSYVMERSERALETGRILPYMFFIMVVITVAYGLLMRIVDPHDFPSVGLALWWAAATVTTIGYGDVVPTTHFGRLVASGLMIFGFASLSLLSGVVASVFVHRSQKAGSRSEMVMLDQRLAEIERLLRERAS
jgi:voltage-gated potassium channel